MTSKDKQILFRVAQWVDCNRKELKTIRQLAETEENYLIIIREVDRVKTQLHQARSLGADATLTLVEWLITLEDFGWRCAYCQARSFQVMCHVISLPEGGTIPENCVPACYGCKTRYKNDQQVQDRIQTYLANRKNKKDAMLYSHRASSSTPLS